MTAALNLFSSCLCQVERVLFQVRESAVLQTPGAGAITACREYRSTPDTCYLGWEVVVVVGCCLLYVPATCKRISGMDLLRQLYALPH